MKPPQNRSSDGLSTTSGAGPPRSGQAASARPFRARRGTASGHAGLHRRTGNSRTLREATRRRGIRQPAAAQHAAPGRSHHGLRARGKFRRQSAAQTSRRRGQPLQHLQAPGLPPGPICSPGLACLKAAANPEQHDYIYFVARGEDGSHVFSTNLAAHNKAVREYWAKGEGSRFLGGRRTFSRKFSPPPPNLPAPSQRF